MSKPVRDLRSAVLTSFGVPSGPPTGRCRQLQQRRRRERGQDRISYLRDHVEDAEAGGPMTTTVCAGDPQRCRIRHSLSCGHPGLSTWRWARRTNSRGGAMTAAGT